MEVGQTVYADFGRYGSIDVKLGKVLRITPTGQIAVQFPHRPDSVRFKNGWMIGGDARYLVMLVDEVKYSQLRSEQDRRGTMRSIAKIGNDMQSGHPLDQIKEAIAKMGALVAKLEGNAS